MTPTAKILARAFRRYPIVPLDDETWVIRDTDGWPMGMIRAQRDTRGCAQFKIVGLETEGLHPWHKTLEQAYTTLLLSPFDYRWTIKLQNCGFGFSECGQRLGHGPAWCNPKPQPLD